MTGYPPFLRPVVVGGGRVVWDCGCGAGCGGGGARARPAADRVARRSGPAQALAPFPVPGRSSLWTASCCLGVSGDGTGLRLIGDRPHRRPPRRRASPAQFFFANCGGLSVGWRARCGRGVTPH
jgi:hypothetical protein